MAVHINFKKTRTSNYGMYSLAKGFVPGATYDGQLYVYDSRYNPSAAPVVTWIAPAETLIILLGIGLLLGGVMLYVGFKTRLAALALRAILIPITLTKQVNNPEGAGQLFKIVALPGMLFFFMVNGTLYYSLDQVLEVK